MITQVLKTQVVCDKCNIIMEQVAPGEFFCENGHRKLLYDLIPLERRVELNKLNTKRERKIGFQCPICAEYTELVSEKRRKGKIVKTYACGHSETVSPLAAPKNRDERWNDFYPFQQDGIEFIESAGYNAQLADEMGLGKTMQALGTLRYNYANLTPTLIICEASKVYDWADEFRTWLSDRFDGVADEPIIHKRGKLPLVGGFKNHIISMSLLHKPKVLKSILKYGFKFLIVDESHSFKNVDTERTYALQQIARGIKHRLFLSGTPIQNKVLEYYVPLNILRPDIYYSADVLSRKCDISSSGRVLGVSRWHRARFFNEIDPFVLRRTKKDAGIELPNLRLHKHKVAISSSTDADTIKGYNSIIDQIEARMNSTRDSAMSSRELLGFMASLRHLTGIAKIKPVVQMIHDFMESTDVDQKITIGIHHRDVAQLLSGALIDYKPLMISSEAPEKKMQILDEFKKPERRLLIASVLGAGQGLNIQFCKNAILMERQWNPSKEEQFMGRFHRIEKDASGKLKIEFDDAIDSVQIDTLNAAGFIDEYLDILVSMKTHVVDSTNDEEFPYDRDFLLKLCELLIKNRPQLPSEL
jgi:SNF2 family DNA or RNA helicase